MFHSFRKFERLFVSSRPVIEQQNECSSPRHDMNSNIKFEEHCNVITCNVPKMQFSSGVFNMYLLPPSSLSVLHFGGPGISPGIFSGGIAEKSTRQNELPKLASRSNSRAKRYDRFEILAQMMFFLCELCVSEAEPSGSCFGKRIINCR